MQIIFGTILCILWKSLVLTRATITFMPKNTTSNSLQKENVSMYPDLNFTQDISLYEKSVQHMLNFKSDRSYSDSTVKNEREVDEDTLANTSIIPESIESSLKKPSLRAFVQFDSQFTEKVNDIFVTLRWNQSEFIDLQRYTVQCFFIEDLKEIQICDDKNIPTIILEHTVHKLKPNTTYYFRVRAHTEDVAGPYSDFINVSTTHENPIPKLLLVTDVGIHILDLDSNTMNNIVEQRDIIDVAYCAQEDKIYWVRGNNLMTSKITENNLMTSKITENNIIKIVTFDYKALYVLSLCIDWVARNLYIYYDNGDYSATVKFDLTMWENGIIKFDKIYMAKKGFDHLIVSPSMGILYRISYNWTNKKYGMMKYFDGKNEQIVQINSSLCQFPSLAEMKHTIIDDMNNEPLIYCLTENHVIVTNINVSMCNTILHKKSISDNIIFESITTDKIYVYILVFTKSRVYYLYALEKKYASLKSYLQPYPPTRCLTPYEKDYNFEKVTATTDSIIVNLPEPVVKSGCKKYNLPTTIYTISVSCLDHNLNKYEEFNMQSYERYYEIQNLTPFTMYKLKFNLSNFYFDQLSINPFESNVTQVKTNLGKLNAPKNISVVALTPTIAVVHWMPLKKLICEAVTYEVHWKSVTLVNDTQQKSKQFINVPKRMADGRFFTKMKLSLSVQDYLIYVRVYPSNFSDFYNESFFKIDHIYSEPNNIILSEANINSMNISWISNINLTVFSALEYKDVATEKWQTTNYVEINYNEKVIYHIENLQSGTLYKFRLILRYLEYEENFIWPDDERFIFSTHGSKRDISSTPGITPEKYYLLLLMLSLFVIIIICVFYFYHLYRQRRNNNEQLLSSTMVDMELAILHEVPCRNTEFNMIYSPMLHYNPDECVITKIALKQITFTKLIGSGAFGMVFQGSVKNLERSGTEISVAIKTIPKDASSHEKKKLLKEAELMNHFRHKHLLRLLAICLDGDSPLLVLELMETDLLKYLRDCRNLQASDTYALRLQDLLAMCEDVARGCCYLEELRLVHRDLACRNCLVSARNRENRIVKIGDFGLAGDIYRNDYYRVRGEGLFPVRWMAPESLVIGIFTSLSDVWSFGVLMWEITSLGEEPYNAKTNEEVVNYVRAGGRLPMTLNCPSPLYQLMLRCWSTADARPNFKFCLKNIIVLRENMEDALLSPVDTF
ncbi:proto-oncogene tyrosine-protein kinase ROS-like [Camponotus floridanus]|uniref:proto-oncogene tyrosine-protein kinase ROS-like n=1 Tax=Camponotus floridanus TaxID=104421 RepID=UPI000DC66DB2|nr:proto-oncogene tyrosine-protein kinase ROS-like [Camponotus floridanus]